MTETLATARTTDPQTSHDAAASLSSATIRGSQQDVLNIFKTYGPMTDDRMVGYASQSPSGARTRRKELVAKGLIQDSGLRTKLESGRTAIVWEVVNTDRKE